MPDQPAPPRFRFSLRTLVIVVALAGSGYAWHVRNPSWGVHWTLPRGKLNSDCVSNDGKLLLTVNASLDAAILWDVDKRTPRHTLTGGGEHVTRADFSPQGDLALVVVGDEWSGNAFHVWDTVTGKRLSLLKSDTPLQLPPRNPAKPHVQTHYLEVGRISAGFLPDGKTVLFDQWTYEQERTGEPHRAESILFEARTGKALERSVSDDPLMFGILGLFTPLNPVPPPTDDSGRFIQPFFKSKHTGPIIRSVYTALPDKLNDVLTSEFPRGNAWVVLSDERKRLEVWDVAGNARVSALAKDPSLAIPPDTKLRAKFSMNGSYVYLTAERQLPPTASVPTQNREDTGAFLWETASGRLIRSWAGLPQVEFHGAFTPDERELLLARSKIDNTIPTGGSIAPNPDRIETATGRVLGTLDLKGSEIAYWMRFSPDGARVLGESSAGDLVHLLDLRSGKTVHVFEGLAPPVWRKGGGRYMEFLSDDRIFHASEHTLTFLKRTRPEQWYGIFHLKEFWLTLALTLALLWSVRRDWRGLRVA